jgi:hypothetical protein
MSSHDFRALVLCAVALSVAALAWAPTAASAAATGVTLTASASPTTQSAVDRGGVNLDLGFSASYDNFATSQSLREAVFHLDDDFAFDATGLTTCPLPSIQGKFHDQAVAACPNSIVGSGTVEVNGGAITGVVDAFHGGGTLVYLQVDVGPGDVNLTLIGTLGASTRGGDFGTQLDLTNIPNTPGLVFTQFDLSFPNQEPSPGHHYVSARCEADQVWDFASDFEFYDSSTFMASTTTPCQSVRPTGQRAAALRKCKKKAKKKDWTKKKLRKCKKNARELPV